MQRGKFITIEGIEGVGKSTNIDYLAGIIEANGYPVMKTREPGGTPIAERIRNILKEHGDEPLPDVAELLLMFAARSINVNNAIQPALSNGTWVISDRFTDSTRAYQGGGRGFPRDSIEWLAAFVHGDLQPDLTILLDAPVEIAMQRADRRGDPDRFEVERAEFFDRIRQSYLQLAESEPGRFVVVDCSLDLEAVQAAISEIAAALLITN
ncbi:MAG: dTMP kinase [Gammaproteobacteria bacterium]|nr:dTMP kinase [Gammaproteobacteria bacterium]MDH3846464.1 dTMP kinase [Gammaproteobacteria bacterium]MDH3863181.1 dTMP kinase [Gammaproteobacteria bacterium]MDH3905747.1 dTMP kinase [Gammaproteobacteria bacterium]MDH4005525.1 dTMP kinase [Gammaproteobacteria bacterium]